MNTTVSRFFLSAALLACAACSRSEPSRPGPECQPGPGHVARGVVTVTGRETHEGTKVRLGLTGLSTRTAADGSFEIACAPVGTHSLEIDAGTFTETIPGVVVQSDTDAWVVAEAIYPLAHIDVERARRLASRKGIDGELLLSPDRTRVVYFTEEQGGSLEILPLDGSAPALLDVGVGSARTVFTPDGRHLVWLTEDGVLRAARSSGGPSVTLGKHVVDWVGDDLTARVSPDGDGVLFLSYDAAVPPALMSASFAGGPPRPLHEGVTWGDYAFAPGGEHAVFTAYEPGSWQRSLYSADLVAGDTIPLAENIGWSSPGFRLAGDRVVFLTGTNWYQRSILSAKLDGEVATLANDAYGWGMQVSPDGSRVAYTAGYSMALRAVSTTGGNATILAPSTSYNGTIRFTPDGSGVLYGVEEYGVQGTTTLRWVGAGGGDPVDLATGVPMGYAFDITFSEDGRWAALVSDFDPYIWTGTLDLVDLATLEVRSLAEGVPAQPDVRFSDDGERILFARGLNWYTGAMELAVARTADAAVTTLSTGVTSWEVDGSGLRVYAISDLVGDLGTLLFADLSGEPAVEVLATDVDAESLRLSPNGSIALFATAEPDGTRVLSMAGPDGSIEALLRNAGAAAWIDDSSAVVVKSGAEEPYGFQDGIYRAALPVATPRIAWTP